MAGLLNLLLLGVAWAAPAPAHALVHDRPLEPRGGTDCDTPIEKLQAYGRSIRANSTPTWFLENGERYAGALPFEEVRRRLDAASPPRR